MKFFLFPISIVYSGVMLLRNLCYDTGIFKSIKLNKPVISVGNLSVGGTGKTPVVEMIIEILSETQKKIAVISRGYKRVSAGPVIVSDGNSILVSPESAGDEPFQIAAKYPKVVVAVDADRIRIAKLVDKKYDIDIFLLDDCFQHRRVERDLNILTINAEKSPFFDYMLPYGRLRENRNGFKRADVALITRCSDGNCEELQKAICGIKKMPVLNVSYEPVNINAFNGNSYPVSYLNGKKLMIFSGIADNSSFEKLINSLKSEITEKRFFDDHHYYSIKEIKTIYQESKNCDIILTTEKDYSRLRNFINDIPGINADKYFYLKIQARVVSQSNLLKNMLYDLIYGKQKN